MKTLFQRSKETIREEGVWLLLKKAFQFVFVRIRWVTALVLRPFIVRKIKAFNAGNSEDILNFTQSSYLRSFIRPAQVKSEFLGLLNIFKEKAPKVVVEIGTANGGTLFCFSRLAPEDATIISIDLPSGDFGGGYPKSKIPLYYSFKKGGQKMFLLREDSHTEQTLEKVKEILNAENITFLFIDGDHTYEGVKCDFGLYGPMVRKGGLIAFHDIVEGPPEKGVGVPQFWHEVKSQYRHVEIIENRDQGGYGIGVLYVD